MQCMKKQCKATAIHITVGDSEIPCVHASTDLEVFIVNSLTEKHIHERCQQKGVTLLH